MTIQPDLNDYMFVSELCRLSFLEVATDELSLSVEVEGAEVFANTYVPDPGGGVTVYDLDRLLEPLIDGLYVDTVISVNGVAHEVKVFACDAAVSEPAVTFLPDFFLTPVMTERDTAIGRLEILSAFCREEERLMASCTFLLDDGGVETRTVEGPLLQGAVSVDVSPALFVSSPGRLISYTLTCGKRKARYRVLGYAPEADPALIYRNCFHVMETIYLTGKKETVPAYSRSSAVIGGRLRNYDVTETMSYKAMTGPLRPGVESAVYDLARSREVFLLSPDGSPGDEVTVTDCDLKRTNEDDAIPDFSITYRRADRRNHVYGALRPPRLFDKTFDETFE